MEPLAFPKTEATNSVQKESSRSANATERVVDDTGDQKTMMESTEEPVVRDVVENTAGEREGDVVVIAKVESSHTKIPESSNASDNVSPENFDPQVIVHNEDSWSNESMNEAYRMLHETDEQEAIITIHNEAESPNPESPESVDEPDKMLLENDDREVIMHNPEQSNTVNAATSIEVVDIDVNNTTAAFSTHTADVSPVASSTSISTNTETSSHNEPHDDRYADLNRIKIISAKVSIIFLSLIVFVFVSLIIGIIVFSILGSFRGLPYYYRGI